VRPISFPLARAPPAPPVRSRTVANDPRIAAARKPDGIDFIGNSKISSFPQNPHPTAPHGIFIPWHRAAFRRAASNSQMARLERPGRRGCCHPRPPQSRTCRFPASGSSRERFADGIADGHSYPAMTLAQCAALIAPYGLQTLSDVNWYSNSRALPRFPANRNRNFCLADEDFSVGTGNLVRTTSPAQRAFRDLASTGFANRNTV